MACAGVDCPIPQRPLSKRTGTRHDERVELDLQATYANAFGRDADRARGAGRHPERVALPALLRRPRVLLTATAGRAHVALAIVETGGLPLAAEGLAQLRTITACLLLAFCHLSPPFWLTPTATALIE